jgi:hypothetical protein
VAYNGHFAKNCFHPLFCFTGDGDCLGARLRPGNIHSADGAMEFIGPIVKRYRTLFKLFWFRGDAAFAKPGIYEYREEQRITSFIRLPANENLDKPVAPHLSRPVGHPRAAFRSRSLISAIKQRVGASLAGWWARSNGTGESFSPRMA